VSDEEIARALAWRETNARGVVAFGFRAPPRTTDFVALVLGLFLVAYSAYDLTVRAETARHVGDAVVGLFALFIAYLELAVILNRSRFVVEGTKLRYAFTPLPAGGAFTLAIADIKRIEPYEEGGKKPSRGVRFILREGAPRPLVLTRVATKQLDWLAKQMTKACKAAPQWMG
jgi:hypothetical protein